MEDPRSYLPLLSHSLLLFVFSQFKHLFPRLETFFPGFLNFLLCPPENSTSLRKQKDWRNLELQSRLLHLRYNMAMADSDSVSHSGNTLNLASVRDFLIRQEDTIVFSLIERARYPVNSRLYNQTLGLVPGFSGSLVHFIVKETEAIQAKAGRYGSPEENPFFPNGLPPCLVPTRKHTQVLHPVAASININDDIWDMYFNQLLPMFVAEGDDGNYASTAASDLNCLQALSRRIHYGKFVAEVKYREAPEDYEPLIRAKDRDALMNLLTFKNVEEMVKKRVAKKATVFGQEVTLGNNTSGNYKVDPSIVSHLYAEWVMPLTKLVEVEYLLRRLD